MSSPEDVKLAKEMTKLEWEIHKNHLLPSGCTPQDERLIEAVSCELAQKCVLNVVNRMKAEIPALASRLIGPIPSNNNNTSTNNVEHDSKPTPHTTHATPRLNDVHRLNQVQRLRRSVMILAAGWKATESCHITFVEVQGMSLRNVVDQIAHNEANWHDVGQIMLLPDAMWSWRGNFQTLGELIGIIRQRAPFATVYLCGIPVLEPTKIDAWQLHRIKLFNQFVFKLCSNAPNQSVQVFYLEKFINEYRDQWQPTKPYYPKLEAAAKIVASIVKVFEHLATTRLASTRSAANAVALSLPTAVDANFGPASLSSV